MRNAGELPWLLVGGGLANCLLALRLEALGIDFRLLECRARPAGDHTWSSHETDYAPEDVKFVSELATFSWDRYEVRFPQYAREIRSKYFTIRSEDLRRILFRRIPQHKILTSTIVKTVREHAVETAKGIFLAEHIVRADGFPTRAANCGYQKFVGWDLCFREAHGLKSPVLMDATVAQLEGYRFVYLLPFDEHRLLVEDTRYSKDAAIDEARFAQGITDYVNGRFPGNAWRVERREQAALPIPLGRERAGADAFGVAGGFFHPTTGYSLPYAVRGSRELIEKVRAGRSVSEALRMMSAAQKSNQDYYLLLNRMMFLAARDEERWRIFARFYRLDEKLIGRFYAGQSSLLDKVRILAGKPPVKIWDALKSLKPRREEPAWN